MLPSFIPRKPIRHRARDHASPAPPPLALTLVAASYDVESESVTLGFDRAVDASGFDPAQVTVQDGQATNGRFVGTGPASVIDPATIQIFLEQIGSATVADVELSATALTGIVAVDDGGTWAGASDLVLPFVE